MRDFVDSLRADAGLLPGIQEILGQNPLASQGVLQAVRQSASARRSPCTSTAQNDRSETTAVFPFMRTVFKTSSRGEQVWPTATKIRDTGGVRPRRWVQPHNAKFRVDTYTKRMAMKEHEAQRAAIQDAALRNHFVATVHSVLQEAVRKNVPELMVEAIPTPRPAPC